jgi:acetyl/propionyl-CoA carboxylase alpha subunit
MHRFIATQDGNERELTLEDTDIGPGRRRVHIGDRACDLDVREIVPGTYSVLLDGRSYLVDVDKQGGDFVVQLRGYTALVGLADARRKLLRQAAAARGHAEGPYLVRSPMPGKLVKLLVKAGDTVTAQTGVAVVEAMKMENELRAGRDGTVKKVRAQEGQALESGQELIEIE